jgi:hypothetical protein
MAYSSLSSIDPGEYSPTNSNPEIRRAEAQKFFNKATAKDRCHIVSSEFDSSWKDDPVEVKVKADSVRISTYYSEDDDSDSSKATHSVQRIDFQSQPSSVRDTLIKPLSRLLSSIRKGSTLP